MLSNYEKRSFLTVPETAEVLRLSKNTVYIEIRKKRIPSVKVAGKILVPVDELKAMLASTLEGGC